MTYGKFSRFTKWLGVYFLFLILGAVNIGTFGSCLKLIAIIPALIWLVESHRFTPSSILLSALLFSVWAFASSVWSIDLNKTIERIFSLVSFCFLLIAVSGYKYGEDEIVYLKRCLIASSRLTALVVLISGSYYEGRIYLSGIVNEDPNYLCAYFLFGIVAALLDLFGTAKKVRKLTCLAELVIYAYIVIASGSRGGLLAILVSVLCTFLYKPKSEPGRHRGGFAIIISIPVLFAVALVASKFIDAEILNRFSVESILTSQGTGRFGLWRDAFNAYRNSSLFREFAGYGTATARDITYMFPFERHNVFHNMFVETLLELGIVGELLYIAHIVVFVKSSKREKDPFCFAVVCGMIALSISTSIYSFTPYWNIMLFIMCISQRNGEADESKYCSTDIQC